MATPRRIAFINEKGGSAKTTLVASMASYLALKRGRRVLAIDMDPQGQLGKVLGVDTRRSRRTSASNSAFVFLESFMVHSSRKGQADSYYAFSPSAGSMVADMDPRQCSMRQSGP